MTSAVHDEIRAELHDYALGILDASDRARLQAHVVECAACQAELAQLRTVVAGIGMATPEAPPDSLKARVLQGATVMRLEERAAPAPVQTHDIPGRRWMPLALAASIMFGVLAAGYAWSLRTQLASARQQAADAADYVARLRQELVATRRGAAELTRVMNILNAPNLLRVELKGQTDASEAAGQAFWSANGVFFSARGLRPLDAGRVYQLWAIRGTTATSAGTMTPDANGAVMHAAAAPADAPDAFGVTIEPAGGSATPTLPVVMLGRAN